MRILLVEDTLDVGEAISRRFETIGHTVDWETNGRAASEILDFTEYDLVILDGLGAVGKGMHTPFESIYLPSLRTRAKAFTHFLQALEL